MDASFIVRKLRDVVPYIIPSLAAFLLLQVTLEAKYQEGWFAAHGCHAEKGCVVGSFHAIEYSVIGALVLASFILVGLGRSRWGNGLASVLALLAAMAWIGMTR